VRGPCLPRALLNTGNAPFVGEFAEADAAEVEITHVAMRTTTAEATIHRPSAELGLLVTSYNN